MKEEFYVDDKFLQGFISDGSSICSSDSENGIDIERLLDDFKNKLGVNQFKDISNVTDVETAFAPIEDEERKQIREISNLIAEQSKEKKGTTENRPEYYDSEEDETNEHYIREIKTSEHLQQICCGSCFAVVSLEAQQHEKDKSLFRTMLAFNVKTEGQYQDEKENFLSGVQCNLCNTDIGVFHMEEEDELLNDMIGLHLVEYI
eukprot:snap_masked-scaffold_11-processed-gene-5.33-mRNA-1 protein AED:1.00 eAED:1.00 QI:0/0/0/0/1/1/2/0/203